MQTIYYLKHVTKPHTHTQKGIANVLHQSFPPHISLWKWA